MIDIEFWRIIIMFYYQIWSVLLLDETYM